MWHLLFPFTYRFTQTKASTFPMQAMLLKDFVFFQINLITCVLTLHLIHIQLQYLASLTMHQTVERVVL